MTGIVLYRIDEGKRMFRYYAWDVQQDLFGQWCLMRTWGRIGRHGQSRETAFPSIGEAESALERQRQIKQRRGYSDPVPMA